MKQHTQILLSFLYTSAVIPAGKRVSSAMDGELKCVHVSWIPAQICLEQICINPKGDRQESLSWIPAGMTGLNTLVYNDETCSQLKQVDTPHF